MVKFGEKLGREKLSALLITVTILIVLVLSGPASAFKLALGDFDNSNPTRGDKISTTSSINIRSDERINLTQIDVLIDGAVVCSFDSMGAGNCSSVGIDVNLLSSDSGYGYGYGYQYGYNYGYGYQQGFNNGVLGYDITLDTSFFPVGDHTLELGTSLGTQDYNSESRTFTVKAPVSGSSSGGGCITSWECSDWSACTNNIQTRSCTKVLDYCYGGNTPNMTQSCSSSTGSGNDNTSENTTTTNGDIPAQNGGGITGAVIGTLGTGGTVFVIIFILLAGGSAVYLTIRRKRRLAQTY
jgi:hypothetical protein